MGSTTWDRLSQVLTAQTVTVPYLTFIQLWLSICSHSNRPIDLCTDIMPNVNHICPFYTLILWPPEDDIVLGCHISNTRISFLLTLAIWCQNISNLDTLGLKMVT